jgi:hypothetical protein
MPKRKERAWNLYRPLYRVMLLLFVFVLALVITEPQLKIALPMCAKYA